MEEQDQEAKLNKIIIYKNKGKFYQVFKIDAYIFKLLFGYKVINEKCGFPDVALSKVQTRLELEKVSYEIIFKDESKSISKDYGQVNKYDKISKKALQEMEVNNRLEFIEHKIQTMNLKELEELIEVICEKYYK